MGGQKVQVVYFDAPGAVNTDETLALAKARADALGIKTVVVATTSGATGVKAGEVFRKGYTVVAVTHATSFVKPNENELQEVHRLALLEHGVKLVTCQHAFGGINRAIRRKFNTYQVDEIIAETLRLMGQGTKVAVECVLMAADAGRVRVGESVVAIAGTNGGADTALVVLANTAQNLFDIRIQEVICKPAFRA